MTKILKFAAPMVVLALSSTALAGCDGSDISINGKEGVPLSEVEIAGPPPSELVLSSGDTVILTEGETFAIKVEGQDTESLRFVRDSEVIGITRTDGWSGNQTATIRITMPPPSEVVIAGSGTVQAQSLASTSEISIGGSGTISFTNVAAERLDVNIGGSGKVTGAGTAKRLEINIGGSGDVELAGLKADSAEVSIGGAGDVAFASDGTVEANIAGSGDVKVAGSAKCTVNAFGSGRLTCAPVASGATAAIPAPVETPETPPTTPGVPIAPKAPTAPIVAKPAQ
ncbi:MAG TPA: head GIN domain-containing protein [Erythrobacter sp.]|nr:head GIN domain-containing protein [Erythrobacter sp.]